MSTRVVLASVSLPALSQAYRYAQAFPGKDQVEFTFHYLNSPRTRSTLDEDIRSADLLITDMMGSSPSVHARVARAASACRGLRICIGGRTLGLNRFGRLDESGGTSGEEEMRDLGRIGLAWKRAEYSDIGYILDLMLGRYLHIGSVHEAEYRECSTGAYIKHPFTLAEYRSAEDYEKDHPSGGRQRVLLTYSGSCYPHSSICTVRAVFEKLSEFADVVPVALNSYNISCIPEVRALAGRVDAIVNMLAFRFLAGPMGGDSRNAVGLLKEFDAPVFSPFLMSKTPESDWSADPAGVNPMEFMLNVFLPELDGAVCTIPVGFTREMERLDDYGLSVSEIMPCDERISRLCGKVRGILSLRSKPNSEKRIAIISYNYPPGEHNLFGGSMLDGSGSISSILGILSDAGYSTERRSPEELVSFFIDNGILNDGEWHRPSESMIRYRSADPHSGKTADAWGKAPGTIMTEKGSYLIPGTLIGNVFVGIQPPRVSDDGDISASYHDPDLPPHHQYVAFYDWILKEFRADAVVHLGTHGTLEFLPGKECAMSGDCFPDRILGDIPHFYIYYAGNPSEAMIAKRRTHGDLISYMPPPFVRSGLYGDLVELEEMLDEYRESKMSDSGRSGYILESIARKAEDLRMPSDPEELEEELVSIRESLIPSGLHTFGCLPSHGEAVDHIRYSLRFPQEGLCGISEEVIDDEGFGDRLQQYISEGSAGDPVMDFASSAYSRYRESLEAPNLLRALDGGYIEAAPGGDAIKNTEVLPSGRNIVQFNPDKVPTFAAFERGSQAASDAVSQFISAEGHCPGSAALVLWGLETSRTQGMTIGQICGYLGLRMTGNSGPFADRFEPIPVSELGRPRIDVTVSMCGFFRDMFPELIDGIGTLFDKVAALDEPEDVNPIRAHNRRNREYLVGEGYGEDDAVLFSGCRLFGPRDGEYGSGMTDLVNTSSWKDESELGNKFTDALHYAYAVGRHAVDTGGLLRLNHGRVELLSQIRDSSDREIIDLDHYYEFIGGLSKSVEMSTGRKAVAFVVDGSGPKVKTQDLGRNIEHAVRARLLNPRWIDGLLSVKYHGAQNINDRFENVLGLAATTGRVDTGVFSNMMSVYVEDEEMRRRLMDNNNWAYMGMLNRLSEAQHRGYWKATEEELETLAEAMEEAEDRAEEDTDI